MHRFDFGAYFSTSTKLFLVMALSSSSGLWLQLWLPLPPKPTGEIKKRGHPPGQITQYDSEIISLNNDRKIPSHIAEILCQEHGLDPQMMNRKTVERRLHTIKTKGLAKLAPVNEDADLLARDTAKRCKLQILFSTEILYF